MLRNIRPLPMHTKSPAANSKRKEQASQKDWSDGPRKTAERRRICNLRSSVSAMPEYVGSVSLTNAKAPQPQNSLPQHLAFAFAVSKLKYRYVSCQMHCLDCQTSRLRPSCTSCGQRPAKPLQCPVDGGYLCPSCHYPPCDKFGVTPRPDSGRYSVLKKPSWTCAKCC